MVRPELGSLQEHPHLDGFQNRCLRIIIGTKLAFTLITSNASVLDKAGCVPLTDALEKQQLLPFGKIAREPEDSPLRESVLHRGKLEPMACKLTWKKAVRDLRGQAIFPSSR